MQRRTPNQTTNEGAWGEESKRECSIMWTDLMWSIACLLAIWCPTIIVIRKHGLVSFCIMTTQSWQQLTTETKITCKWCLVKHKDIYFFNIHRHASTVYDRNNHANTTSIYIHMYGWGRRGNGRQQLLFYLFIFNFIGHFCFFLCQEIVKIDRKHKREARRVLAGNCPGWIRSWAPAVRP